MALTVWQPWASALAAGIKKNETRSWATKYRGPIVIHAAACSALTVPRSPTLDSATTCRELLETFGEYKEWGALPTGAVLAVGNLVGCEKLTPEFVAGLSETERALGDYTPGRYAWKIEDVLRLSPPVHARGKQGLWEWPGLVLKHQGRDSWDRPVYVDFDGRIWKDVEPRKDYGPKLCTALYNAFDGEPDIPMAALRKYQDMQVVFAPERDTWTW